MNQNEFGDFEVQDDPEYTPNQSIGLLDAQYPAPPPPPSYEIDRTQQWDPRDYGDIPVQDEPAPQPVQQEDPQQFEAQAQADAQAERMRRIEATRARLQAQDAARAPQDEQFNPETGAQANPPERLNSVDQALLGAGQGLAEIGKQAGGLIQAFGPGNWYGRLTSPQEVYQMGKALTEYSTEQAKQFEEAGKAEPTDTSGQIINWLASSATSMLPIVATGAGGPAAMAITMGAQSFGNTYNAAREAGFNASEALAPAMMSGAISSAIGAATGHTGLGALGSKALAGDTVKQIVGTIARDMGLGGVQGFTDALSQGIIQKATFAPDKTWAEIVPEAVHAMGAGAFLGAAASGVHQALGVVARKATAPLAESTPPVLPTEDVPRGIEAPVAPPVTVPTTQSEALPVQVEPTPKVAQSASIQKPETDGPLNQFLGRRVKYNGYEGTLGIDQVGQMIIQADDGRTVEIAGGKGDAKLFDTEVSLALQRKGQYLPDDSVTIDGVNYRQPQFNRDNNGNVVSLTATRADGRPVTIREPELALDLGLQAANHAADKRLAAEPKAHAELEQVIDQHLQKANISHFYDQLNPVLDLVDEGLSLIDAQARIGKGKAKPGMDLPEVRNEIRQRLTGDNLRVAKASVSHVIEQIERSGLSKAEITRATDPLYETLDQIDRYEKNPVKNQIEARPVTEATAAEYPERLRETPVSSTPDVPTKQPAADATTASVPRNDTVPVEAPPVSVPGQTGEQVVPEPPPLPERKGKPLRYKPAKMERPPDIIDELESIGKIRSRRFMKKGTEGYYSEEYNQAVKGAGTRLFHEKGMTPDVAAQSLRDAGHLGRDSTVEDMWVAINKAKAQRNMYAAGEAPEQKAAAFAEAIDPAGKSKKQKLLSVGDLEVGDKFRVDGEEFVVKHIDPDTGEVSVEDGRKFGHQTIPDGADIAIDKRSIAKVPRKSVDDIWNVADEPKSTVPKLRPGENQGDILAKQSEPIKLVGENIDPKASLTDMPVKDGPRLPQSATGREAIRELLSDPDNGMDADARKVATAFADDPVLGKILTTMEFNLQDTLLGDDNMAGYSIRQTVIGLSRNAPPDTFVHEGYHTGWLGLPKAEKAVIEAGRLQALREKFGDNIPAGLEKGMNVAEFKASGLPLDVYPLSSAEEYGVGLAAKRFANKVLDPKTQTIVSKIQDWVKAVARVVRKALGADPTFDQAVDNLVNGRYESTPELNAKSAELRASFVQSAEDATNATRLARDAEDRAIEGKHFLSQTFDLHEALKKQGADQASDKAKRLIGLADKESIVRQGKDLHGKAEGYREIKAATPEPDAKLRIARLAVASFEAADATNRELGAKADEALREISQPSFVRKIQKADLDKLKADTMDQAVTTSKSVLTAVLTKQKTLASEKGLSEIERAKLQGQIAQVIEAQKSSSALSHLVSDMTRVIASTPEGLKLLEEGGNRNDFRRVYRDLKVSTGQPLFGENLMNWASYLMEKAPELRQRMLALELVRDADVKIALDKFQENFLKAHEKDPVKSVMAEFGKQTTLAGNAAKARYAWKELNESLIRAHKNYADIQQAAEISNQALNSPEIVALRKEIRTDAKFIGDQAHLGAGKIFDPATTIVSPTGRMVDLSLKELGGDTFHKFRTEAVAAHREAAEWLATNEPGTANYRYYERIKNDLEHSILSGSALKTNDPLKVGNHTFGILRNVADTSGGRVSSAWKPYLAKAEQQSQKAQHWTTKWVPEVNSKRLAALKAAGIKFGTFNRTTLAQANNALWPELNEIAWSGNRQSGHLQVGDTVGINGRKITAEDIAVIKGQTAAAVEGFKLTPEQTTLDTIAGKNAAFERGAHSTGIYGVPRRPEMDAVPFADTMGNGYKAIVEALKSKDEAAEAQALQKMDEAFADNFARHAKSFTQDREFGIVKDNVTVFDGEDGAFASVWPRIESGEISDAAGYWKALSNASGHTVAEAKKIVLPELGRMADKWNERYAEDRAERQGGVSHETKNAFSRSRNDPVAPYSFYRYGFKDASDVKGFGASIWAQSFDIVTNGLNRVIEDLERVKLERDKKIIQETAKGTFRPRKTVEDRQRQDRNMDKAWDDYKNIEDRIRLAEWMKERLSRKNTVSTAEGIIHRVYDNIVGVSLGSMAAVSDILVNPIILGRSIHRVTGSYIKGGVVGAAAHLEAVARLIPSVFHSGVKGAWNIFIADPSEGLLRGGGMMSGGLIGAVKHIPEDKSVTEFLNRAIIPMVRELTDNFHTRYFEHQKMVEHGIDPESTITKQISNRILGGLGDRGALTRDPDETPGVFNRGANAFLGGFELLHMLTSGNVYKLNDTVANQSFRNVYDHPFIGDLFGPLPQHQRAAKAMAVKILKKGRFWNPDDFADSRNEPSPKEMTNNRLGTSKDKLNIIDSHDRAGIDFRRKWFDAVNEYVSGNKKHEMYSEEDVNKFIGEMASYENKQTKINESQVLKDGTFIAKAIKPYQSWSTRQWSNFWKLTETAFAATEGKTESQAKLHRLLAYAGSAATLLALLSWGALVSTQGNYMRRHFQKALFNQVTAAKLPWEREGTKGKLIGWGLAAANSVPYIGNIANAAFDDFASRAAYDPSIAMLEKAKTIGQYVGGAISSGDPTYRLAETIGSIVPDSKIVLNRLESQSGKREIINDANLYRRSSDPETVKNFGAGHYQVTELTPYAARMANAAVNGQLDELQRIRDEAVEVATKLGKKDPEKSVEQAFRNQFPETKALKNKQDAATHEEFLGRLSDTDRAHLQATEAKFNEGAAALGMKEISAVKAERSSGGGVSRAARLSSGSSKLGGGRAPKIKGLKGIRHRVARTRVRRGRSLAGRRVSRAGRA